LHEDAGGDLNAAFDTLARALTLEPANAQTQEGLMRLAAAAGRFADLARVYEQLAARQDDAELGISLYTVSAQIYEHQLGAVDNAIAHYRRILELDEGQLPAVEALERIFRSADRYQELSQTLQQRAGLLQDVDEQKRALMQAAQIEEEVLERLDDAVAVYLKVLEIDGEDLQALDALIRLHSGTERWPALLEVYGRKVDLVFDPDDRKRIFYQMGSVYEQQVRDLPSAIRTYQQVLEIDPDDREALGRLDALHQQVEDWPELLAVLQHEAELAADPAESIRFQYRIAELYDTRLDDVARAIELYRELLTLQSDHQPTLAALELLTRGERDPVGAAQVLEPIYETVGEWERLIAVLEVQYRASEDDFHRVELLQRIATLREEMLNDPSGAFDTYARAAAIDMSSDETLAQYERLASLVGRWSDLALLYDQQLVGLAQSDPARHGDIGLRLARIYEEQLENYDAAIARYQLVLGQEPDNQAAIASYGEVLAEMPEHDGALQALEGMFNQGVEQLRVAAILEPHYEALGQYDYLGGVYEAVLTHKTDPGERLTDYYRLAELHEERLLQPTASLGVYIRALLESPADERSLEEIERLAALVDQGWSTSPTPTPTPSLSTRPSRCNSRSESAWRGCSRRSSATSTRPRRPSATCSGWSRSTSSASRTSTGSTPPWSATRSSRACSSSACTPPRRPSSSSSSTRASARSTSTSWRLRTPRTSTTQCASIERSSTSSIPRTKPRSRSSSASTVSSRSGRISMASTSGSCPGRWATTSRARSPRRWLACWPTTSATWAARSRCTRRCWSCAARMARPWER
jgi:tetratricopeptide (TPR) repeat protein